MMDVYENALECVQKDERSFRTTFRRTRGSIETNDQEEEAGGWIKLNIDAADTVLNMSHHNLSEERDELQKMYSILMAEKQNLLEEKMELQTINSFLNTSHKNLSEERHELQRLYSVLDTSYQNLSEEKEELQEMYSFLNMSHRNLSEELQRLCSSPDKNHQNVAEEKEKLQNPFSFLQTRDEKNKLLGKLQKLSNAWLYFRGSFYHCSNKDRSWEKSRSFCQEQGADLVAINSEDEQNFVQVCGGRRWIGLSDRETEGVWKWVDGSSRIISSWMSGEPNDADGGEDCGEILINDNEPELNDLPCNAKQRCICEMKLP